MAFTIQQNQTDCIIWRGYVQKRRGYGLRWFNKKRGFLAHRAAWIEANGPIPKGMCVCHHCDNPSCVNPEHLFLGTQADNMADMVKKERQSKLPGSLNPWSILTENGVLIIRAVYGKHIGGAKVTAQRLANVFKVSRHAIWSVIYRNSWKHI